MKLIALVRANEKLLCVFDNEEPLIYKKLNDYTIIGHNGLCFVSYIKNYYAGNNAFAGRHFDLKMNDGEIINCTGQWWDALNDAIIDYLSVTKNNPIIRFSSEAMSSLKKCYCFCGSYILKNDYDNLIEAYSGKIYEYWEYEKKLRKEYMEEKKSKIMLDRILKIQNNNKI